MTPAFAVFALSSVFLDLDADSARQTVVDREPGQYLGHPTTVLLEDGRTMICVYPKGHGKGPVQMKRSNDGGRTWSERLPTPVSWATSLETPTIHRTLDPKSGKKRLVLWSGLYPARLSHSDDDGRTWTGLEPAGDWGGIVVMSSVERLKDGRYLALFHDDGRFFAADGKATGTFTVYKTFSDDGGLSWSAPAVVLTSRPLQFCEPGLVRSPDGKELAALLRENSRRGYSHVAFSRDEGVNWSTPQPLGPALTGDRHTARYGPDGRLVVSFRCMAQGSPFWGDWVAWVGRYDDLRKSGVGQFVVRLKHDTKGGDCAYPGVEVLKDGTFVCTTYGHWAPGEQPYILSVRFKLAELDRMSSSRRVRR